MVRRRANEVKTPTTSERNQMRIACAEAAELRKRKIRDAIIDAAVVRDNLFADGEHQEVQADYRTLDGNIPTLAALAAHAWRTSNNINCDMWTRQVAAGAEFPALVHHGWKQCRSKCLASLCKSSAPEPHIRPDPQNQPDPC